MTKQQLTRRGRSSRAGSAQLEFALCAIFVIFLLISIVDMARGLWINHTLAEAVRDGTRYAIVKGRKYVNPNNDQRLPGARLQNTLNVVRRGAIGLDPNLLELRFEAEGSAPILCNPGCSVDPASTNWPPDGAVSDKGHEIGIRARYPYNSLVVMYFPGGQGVRFGQYVLGSTSRARIVF
jgi:hypothetical protein